MPRFATNTEMRTFTVCIDIYLKDILQISKVHVASKKELRIETLFLVSPKVW